MENARSILSNAESAAEVMKNAESVAQVVEKMADQTRRLLWKMCGHLTEDVVALQHIVQDNDDYRTYDADEQAVVARAVTVAVTLKNIAETALFEEDGSVTGAIRDTVRKTRKFLKKINFDDQGDTGEEASCIGDDAKMHAEGKLGARRSRMPHRDNHRLSGEDIAGIGAGAAGSGTNYADNVVLGAQRGHGFAAEKANHLFDEFAGRDARIVGTDNVRNGPDRLVDGIQIQTKYCSSGAKCVAECFDDGKFRYFDADSSPMQIEVPSDMYEGAVKAMESRIEKGQVSGVSDPAMAKEIVRKGRFTYAQVRNIARFGTIESLTYDAVNGIKLAGQAMGISAALSFAVSIWNGEDFETALKQACRSGIKVGGIAWISSVAAAQLSRTGIEQTLRGSTDWVVKQLGPKATSWVASAMRSGSSIHGAAAANHVSKVLRGNVVTGIAVTAVLSSVDFARMFQGRMSGAQLFKNVATTASGVAGGTAGWMAGATAGAAAGSVVPGVGTTAGAFVGGVLGALAGGTAASKTATVVLDEFIEDDAKQMLAIMETVFGELCVDYLLNEEEGRAVLEDFQCMDLPDKLRDMYASDDHDAYARSILEPLVEKQARARKIVELPSSEDIVRETGLILRQVAEGAG